MTEASSKELHPEHGARFVFVQTSAAPLTYAASIFAAGGATEIVTLGWSEDGEVTLTPELAAPALREALIKLARPLRARAPARMTRWRALDE